MNDTNAEPPHRPRFFFAVPQETVQGFVEFIRERGVMGLAIGFVLGTSVQKVVTSFVETIVNPAISIFTGGDGVPAIELGPFKIGAFVTSLLDFVLLVFIIYVVFKALHLERLDKPKE